MRDDVVAEDVLVLLSGLAASPSALDRRGRSWERHLALAVDGLRAQGADPLPAPPADPAAPGAPDRRAQGRAGELPPRVSAVPER